MFQVIFILLSFIATMAHAAMLAPPDEVVYLPGFDRARIVRDDVLVVRTYTSPMIDRKEYAGARCKAVSDEFEIDFMTPARIALPRIHQRPSNLHIRCTSPRGTGQLVIRPSHPGHIFPSLNPLAAMAFAMLATAENHSRNDWTYVPVGQTRSVTLQWGARPGCETTQRGVHCATQEHPLAR